MGDVENDHLFETRNYLVKEITVLNNNEFNNKPDLNKWSIAQVCHHLILVEKATAKAIIWGLKTINRMKVERKNVHLLLDRTKKIKAPQIVEPEEGPFEIQHILNGLQDSRIKLLNLLSTVEDQSILEEKSVQHPVFGELSLHQWIELIYLHEQRHIEQIKEIKRLLGREN